MEEKVDPFSGLEKKLCKLGYEIFDLGTDFGSSDYLYYVFASESGIPVAENLLCQEEVENVLEQLTKKVGIRKTRPIKQSHPVADFIGRRHFAPKHA